MGGDKTGGRGTRGEKKKKKKPQFCFLISLNPRAKKKKKDGGGKTTVLGQDKNGREGRKTCKRSTADECERILEGTIANWGTFHCRKIKKGGAVYLVVRGG